MSVVNREHGPYGSIDRTPTTSTVNEKSPLEYSRVVGSDKLQCEMTVIGEDFVVLVSDTRLSVVWKKWVNSSLLVFF